MSRTLASTVLAALKSTAVLVTSIDNDKEIVYVYKADNVYDMLATVSVEYDELFEESYYYVVPHWNYGGSKRVAKTVEELTKAIQSLKGYPTDADNRRNWSKPVYAVTDY